MRKRKTKLTKKQKKNLILIIALIFIMILIAFATYGILSGKDSKDSKKATAKARENIIKSTNTAYANSIVVALTENEIVNQIDENIIVEVEETVNEDGSRKIDSDMPYYIRINTQANVVTIYTKDSDGDYTIPVKAMVCSTGEYTPPVPSYPKSMYKTTGYRAVWNGLQGDVYGQYATQIVGNILFHSVPYTAESPDTLEWWEYDKLGTSASLGCIRLTVADAQWIFYNIGSGTVVEFYEDSNPGPLGKPSAQPISGNVECRGWDPTDPEDGNPWRNPKQEEIVKNEEKVNTNENETINNKENVQISNEIENQNKESFENKTITNTQDENITNTENTQNSQVNTQLDNTVNIQNLENETQTDTTTNAIV